MQRRVVAVHPAGDDPLRWSVSELGEGGVLASGAELPGRSGSLRMSAGVALVLGTEVSTPGLDPIGLLDASRSVVAMVEVAAEDGTPSALVSGPRTRPPSGLDLALTGLVVEVDGIQVATAAGAAAAGHPAQAAVLGLASRPLTLPAGSVVFAGRWTALVAVEGGSHLQASFGHLGGVTVGVL